MAEKYWFHTERIISHVDEAEFRSSWDTPESRLNLVQDCQNNTTVLDQGSDLVQDYKSNTTVLDHGSDQLSIRVQIIRESGVESVQQLVQDRQSAELKHTKQVEAAAAFYSIWQTATGPEPGPESATGNQNPSWIKEKRQ